MINKKNGVIIKYMEEVKIKLSFPLHVKKSIDIIQKIIKK